MIAYMLTTTDNPHDPFTEFERWLHFYDGKPYNPMLTIANLALTSTDLSDEDNATIINDAIDELVIEHSILNGKLLDNDSSLKEDDLVWFKKVSNTL